MTQATEHDPDPEAAQAVEPARVEEIETPVSRAAPAPSAKRRGGAAALFIGGVCAAAVGAAATIYLLPQLPARWQPAAAVIAARSAEQAARSDALQAEIDALRAAIPQVPSLDPVQANLARAEARIAELESRPAPVIADSAPALAALQSELADLRAQLAQGAGGAQTTSAEIAAAAAQASARIVAAESEAATVRARAEADAAALRAEAEASAAQTLKQAAVARLRAAFDAGSPLSEPLAQLRATGASVPIELAAEVPTITSLRESFAPAARAALAAARREAPGASMLDRLSSLLLAQTGARSLTPRQGDDADAVLSRAEAALAAGDLEAALAETGKLSDAAGAEMAAWRALAERRLAATNALAALAQSLN